MNAQGFDVSHYQQSVDWQRAYDSGMRLVGIKSTQGNTFVDPKFSDHRAGSRTVPFILRFFYHFAVPGIDPAAQADHMLDVCGSLLQSENLCLDFEARDKDTQRPTLDVNFATAFFSRLLGNASQIKKPFLYVSTEYWGELGNPLWPLASDVDLILKRYAPTPGAPPAPWSTHTIWQKSQTGTVPGIVGKVDLDEFNGDEDALTAYVASGASSPSQP
ncbi:MAG TPA: glycoside hydrolase family 25 protein [Vicinamibacterales bacterium]|jgi:GH25 family lysozyme M1 (1,4-beta-N-acetylmuramidase)|nr:glycoside hydrolase family 25 protein [Vicinamibacterales bacterium]